MPTVVASGAAVSLALDAAHVFWVDAQGDAGSSEGEVLMMTPKAGGPSVALASGIVGRGIALDENNIYVALQGQLSPLVSIARIDKLNGNVTVLVTARDPGCVAVGAGRVYWCELDDNAVESISTSGGNAAVVARTDGSPSSIAADYSGIYWTTERAVQTVGIAGGVVTTLANEVSGASSIAVDSTSVYWLVPGEMGSIAKLAPK
jgi:hypothetical protein